MELRPAWSIEADAADVTAALRGRLLELRLTTTTDRATDAVELRLAGDGAAIPPTGRELTVRMGYEGALEDMGSYWHTETEIELAPVSRILIRATGADLRESATIKAPRSRAWDATTLGAVVRRIASDHGLEARIPAALADVPVEHLDQTAESDMHFLRRLAQRWDATAKLDGPILVFAVAAAATNAAGDAELPRLTITPATRLIDARVTYRDRPKFASVRAAYPRTYVEPLAHVTVPAPADPTFDLPDPYPTKAAAEAAAAAKLSQLTRAAARLEATLPGTPQINAGTPITTSGWPPAANAQWIADRVTHTLTQDGYTTTLSATAP